MNVFVEQNEQFREFGKRISQHNLIQIFLPFALLALFSFIGDNLNSSNEDPILFGGVVTYFIVVLYIGARFKIYTTTSLLSYLVLIPIIGIFLWVLLFYSIGYFAVLLFPLLMLYVGPSFNNTMARRFYISTIEKFKERCMEDPKGLEASFSEVQKCETILEAEQITAELVHSLITNYLRKGNIVYSITSVMQYMNATYIFIENRGCLHVLRVQTNTIQSLSLTTALSSEILNLDQTVNQIKELLTPE